MNAILLLYNSDIPASLADAQLYCARRNLPFNLLGVNFGESPTTVSQSQILGPTFIVKSFVWRGTTSDLYNGDSLQSALETIAQTHAVDGLILSTHTPLVFTATQPPWNRPLPASLARIAWYAQTRSWQGIIANGRLGSPSTMAHHFDLRTEMTTRSGESLADQAVRNAIKAEFRYNKTEPHLMSSGTAHGTTNRAVGLVNPRFGFTTTYYQGLMSYARRNGMTHIVDLGIDLPFNTDDPADFALGSIRDPVSLWGVCLPMSMNANRTLLPGDHPYSNNYVVRPGGWSCHWYSYQWAWSMDFLFNGGSAAVITVDEPYSDGIRDPRMILENLLAGQSMMEAVTVSATPRSCPEQGVNVMGYPDCVTVLGDPLYRPYAIASPHHREFPPARLRGAPKASIS